MVDSKKKSTMDADGDTIASPSYRLICTDYDSRGAENVFEEDHLSRKVFKVTKF